jgi:hypothetical protein
MVILVLTPDWQNLIHYFYCFPLTDDCNLSVPSTMTSGCSRSILPCFVPSLRPGTCHTSILDLSLAASAGYEVEVAEGSVVSLD